MGKKKQTHKKKEKSLVWFGPGDGEKNWPPSWGGPGKPWKGIDYGKEPLDYVPKKSPGRGDGSKDWPNWWRGRQDKGTDPYKQPKKSKKKSKGKKKK